MEGKSGIKTITNKDFVEATNGKIKLKINFRYILDYFGFFGSYKVYDVEADVFYIYDFERDKWIFEGIEILNTPIEKK
jgi:hypothetical protein